MFQTEFILHKDQMGKRIHLQEAHDKLLDRWIAERHYLKSTPCGARLRIWIMDQDGKRIGAMMWGRPSARLLDQETILELTRMYFVDDTERFVESRALALSRRWIRKRFPKVKLVLSYSSTGYGGDKCGRIFAADNWCQFGKTKGGSWKREKRQKRADKDQSDKLRWVRSP